jgi:hypothetical protein
VRTRTALAAAGLAAALSLHEKLTGLLAKNVEPGVKTALRAVDTNVGAWAADPDKWLA